MVGVDEDDDEEDGVVMERTGRAAVARLTAANDAPRGDAIVTADAFILLTAVCAADARDDDTTAGGQRACVMWG